MLDCICNHSLAARRRVLKRTGRLVIIGAPPGRTFVGMLAGMLTPLVVSPFVSQKLVVFVAASIRRTLPRSPLSWRRERSRRSSMGARGSAPFRRRFTTSPRGTRGGKSSFSFARRPLCSRRRRDRSCLCRARVARSSRKRHVKFVPTPLGGHNLFLMLDGLPILSQTVSHMRSRRLTRTLYSGFPSARDRQRARLHDRGPGRHRRRNRRQFSEPRNPHVGRPTPCIIDDYKFVRIAQGQGPARESLGPIATFGYLAHRRAHEDGAGREYLPRTSQQSRRTDARVRLRPALPFSGPRERRRHGLRHAHQPRRHAIRRTASRC